MTRAEILSLALSKAESLDDALALAERLAAFIETPNVAPMRPPAVRRGLRARATASELAAMQARLDSGDRVADVARDFGYKNAASLYWHANRGHLRIEKNPINVANGYRVQRIIQEHREAAS